MAHTQGCPGSLQMESDWLQMGKIFLISTFWLGPDIPANTAGAMSMHWLEMSPDDQGHSTQLDF